MEAELDAAEHNGAVEAWVCDVELTSSPAQLKACLQTPVAQLKRPWRGLSLHLHSMTPGFQIQAR